MNRPKLNKPEWAFVKALLNEIADDRELLKERQEKLEQRTLNVVREGLNASIPKSQMAEALRVDAVIIYRLIKKISEKQ